MMAEAAFFPHMSPADRQKQKNIWLQIIQGVKNVITDIHQAILMGEATVEEMKALLPKTTKVLETADDAMEFFS